MNRNELEAKLLAKAAQEPDFRQRLVADPKKAIASDLGIAIPAELEISIFSETRQHICVVLPAPQADANELSLDELDKVAGGRWIHSKTGGPIWDDREPV